MIKAYTLIKSDNIAPLIFDSPHSGASYPDDFNYDCNFRTLQKAEDHYVDDLFQKAPEYGSSLLSANFPRSYIDPNRSETDIDLELLEDEWTREYIPTSRSHAGIGLIRRLVKPDTPVYNRKLSSQEIIHRIDHYYVPYHQTLKKLLDHCYYRFGQVWHINCHSMPAQSKFGALSRSSPLHMPDFVLGDRDGTSCSLDFTHSIRDFLKGLGYKVAINDPYKGVELVERYSDPAIGRHSLQIEICKSLYMNEDTGKKTKNYEALKSDIEKIIAFIAGYVNDRIVPIAAD